MDIANLVLFLCSDKAGSITGENIFIDGGMTNLMIYRDDHGWTYRFTLAAKPSDHRDGMNIALEIIRNMF